jgi:hypothetical protein
MGTRCTHPTTTTTPRRGPRGWLRALALAALGLGALGAAASEMNLGPLSLGARPPPPAGDYALRLGRMRISLAANMTAMYDDNIDRTRTDSDASLYVGPGLSLGVYWPISPYLQIRTGATLTYWYTSGDDSEGGLEVTGLTGAASDAAIGADIFPHKHIRLHVSDTFSRSGDSLTNAARGVPREAGVTSNEVALQGDVEWTKRIVSYSRVAYGMQWTDDEEYNYMDFTRPSADTAVLWRMNKRILLGPYGAWEATSYNEDKHNDAQELDGGLALVYDGGSALNATFKAGVASLTFDDGNVATATDDYLGPTFEAGCQFATSENLAHSVGLGYAPSQGNLAGEVNYSRDLTAHYGIAVKLRPRLTLSGNLAWVDTRESDGGEHGNLYQAGPAINYELVRNLTSTLAYQYTRKTSDVSDREYDDNLITLSLSYRF